MKKLLVLALVALFVLSFTATVMAAPIDFSGQIRFRADSYDSDSPLVTDPNYMKYRMRLMFSTKVDENWTFGGRLHGESQVETATDKTTFDWLYAKYVAGNNTLSFGRQELTLGQGLLFDNRMPYVGFATDNGKVAFKAVAGTFDKTSVGSVNVNAQSVYAADVAFKANDQMTLGVSYASFEEKMKDDSELKITGVNVKYGFGNAVAALEFAQSDEDEDETAINALVTLGTLKAKGDANFFVGYRKIEADSLNPTTTTLDAADIGTKGFVAGFNYKVNPASTLTVNYYNGEGIDVDADAKRLRVEMVTAF